MESDYKAERIKRLIATRRDRPASQDAPPSEASSSVAPAQTSVSRTIPRRAAPRPTQEQPDHFPQTDTPQGETLVDEWNENSDPALLPIMTLEDLVMPFRLGEKNPVDWSVGIEHEKIGFDLETEQIIPYEGPKGIRMLFANLEQKYGWQPVLEDENPVAMQRNGTSLTLEPGGQMELSGAVLKNARQTYEELQGHLKELQTLAEQMGVGWLTVARNPVSPVEEIECMPKRRYEIMRNYLPTRGAKALEMMLGTSTTQICLDYSNEVDMARKMRLAYGFTPLLTAWFANSPLANGQPTGRCSERMWIWEQVDAQRCGFIPHVLEAGYTYRDYAAYAIDVPMFFIQREGKYIDCSGIKFRDYLSDGHQGRRATRSDWALHLTTLFPHVRLRSYLELRMIDTCPAEMVYALVALVRGLFYSPKALADAEQILTPLDPASLPKLQHEAIHLGLRAKMLNRSLAEWAQTVLEIAAAGLNEIGAADETRYLNPLKVIATSGKTQAEQLLEVWNRNPEHGLKALLNSPFRI